MVSMTIWHRLFSVDALPQKTEPNKSKRNQRYATRTLTGQFSDWDNRKQQLHRVKHWKMASVTPLTAPKERLIVSPPGLSASVWKTFGFYGKANKTLDKTYAICKVCKTKIKYLSNTTNMLPHLRSFHPEREKAPPVLPTQQQTILETVTKLKPVCVSVFRR